MSMGKMKLNRRGLQGFRKLHQPMLILLIVGMARLAKGQLSDDDMRRHGFKPIEEDLSLRGATPGGNVDAVETCELIKQRMGGDWYTFAQYSFDSTRHHLESDNGNPCLHVNKYIKDKKATEEFTYDLDISKLSSDRRVVFSNPEKVLGNLWVLVQANQGKRYAAIIWKGISHIWYRSENLYKELGPKLERQVFADKLQRQNLMSIAQQRNQHRQRNQQRNGWVDKHEWRQFKSDQERRLAEGEFRHSPGFDEVFNGFRRESRIGNRSNGAATRHPSHSNHHARGGRFSRSRLYSSNQPYLKQQPQGPTAGGTPNPTFDQWWKEYSAGQKENTVDNGQEGRGRFS